MCSWVSSSKTGGSRVNPRKAVNQEVVEEIKSIFVLYDKNKDGLLSLNELKTAAAANGFDPGEFEELFHANDTDKNGFLSFDE